jgi:hypothetical protein
MPNIQVPIPLPPMNKIHSHSLHFSPYLKSPVIHSSPPNWFTKSFGAVTLDLSTELGANGLRSLGSSTVCSRCSRGRSTSTSHLNSDDSTEWAGVAGVDDLDEADTGLASDGAGASGASRHGGCEWVVLVDV